MWYTRRMRKTSLTTKQKKYVKARGAGANKTESAIMAGYAAEGGNIAEQSLVAAEKIRTALVEEARKYAEISDTSREKCIAAFVDAANMAKMLGEPASMIAAWREITKICGHYAPETKKVAHMIKGDNMKVTLELMTDEELLKITHGKVYEGEYKQIEAPKDE